MLSDIRNRLNRRRKNKNIDKSGEIGGFDSLPGLGNVNRLSSPFSEHGFDYDLNDVAEIAEKVFTASKKLKEHWTFLNIMRHFLLIPNDEVNGRKMWALVEMFCNQVVLTDTTETTKMKFSEFLPMYNEKDKFTKVRKLDMLVGIENALPILFPNMPTQDEFSEVTWRPGDLVGKGANAEEEEEEEDDDELIGGEVKEKKKRRRRKAEEEDEEIIDEEDEEEEGRPKKGAMKKKQWELNKDKDEASDAAHLGENEIGVVAKVEGHSVRKKYVGDDQDEWEQMMANAKNPRPMGGPLHAGGGPPPPPGCGPPPPPGGGPPPPPGKIGL
jgi:hypothetical protein